MLLQGNLYALMGTLLLGLVSCCDYSESVCGARRLGDITIGVLSSCHAMVQNLHMRNQPERFNCTEFDLDSFVQILSVIHTIDTINDSGFLPGINLGYVVCDTCSDASRGIQSAMHLLALNQTQQIQCELIEQPLVKAIIGARYSEVSTAVARLMGLYMVPQISTTSSATILDDKLRHPAFLRTIPSDAHQTLAWVQLMAEFKWNWVGVVSGDDDYGRAALQDFLKNAEDKQVCAAFNEVVPHNLDHPDIDRRITAVAESIQASKAQVVLLILKGQLVEKLFKVMIRKGISRTWLASDSWSTYQPAANMEGINTIGDIFGFRFMTGQNPGLKQFLTHLSPGTGAVNTFIEEYKNLRFGCSAEVQKIKKSPLACELPDPQTGNDDFLTQAVDLGKAYSKRVAVWAIAHGLHALLKCNETICTGEKNVKPWQLLQEIKNVNFTLDERQFYFDNSSNFATGYELISWLRGEKTRLIKDIGEYNTMKSTLKVTETIEWGTPNKTIPESRCSESCPPGSFTKISMIYCCFNCSKCEEGTYSNVSDLPNCLKCPNGTWSLRGWTKCQQRTEDYLKWDNPFAIALLVSTGIGFTLLLSVSIIFLHGRNCVVFKVAGGKTSFVMMAGLAVSFGAVVLFIGKPNDHVCKSRQTMYGLGFTLAVSCILVKAFRTFLAFLTDVNQKHTLNKLYKPPVIIICGTAIQGLICLFWLIFDAPKVDISRQGLQIVLQCNDGSNWGFGIMLAYIALLASICFLLAFKSRKVPQRFNETGYIIFSMIIYLFVWICFIPIYVTKIKQRPIVQASAIIVSNLGIIFCHFFPKCYMMLCKKKTDIDRQAYLNTIRKFSLTTSKQLSVISLESGRGSLESGRGSFQTDCSSDGVNSGQNIDLASTVLWSPRASTATIQSELLNTDVCQLRRRAKSF